MSTTFSFFRTLAAGFVRVSIAYGGYQLYKFTDYGPGVPFYEYREMMLDYSRYSREDIGEWIERNDNREVLLNPSFDRVQLWKHFISECHMNWGLVTGSVILGLLAGRKSWEHHISRFIRGRRGYYTIKYQKSRGPSVKNGSLNEVFTYSQLPYRWVGEEAGFLKECTFKVPVNLYLHDIIVDIKKAIEVDEGDSIIPDISIRGHYLVNIADPQKASALFLNIEDSEEMGKRASEYICNVILERVRENKLLVKHMQENPEEYIKYLNKYLKQLVKQNIGVEVMSSDIQVVMKNQEKDEDKEEVVFE